MKKAVIYARYSSSAQTDQSIEGQLRVCNEFAKNNDIFIVHAYIDRATTGTNDNREAFQCMLKDSEKNAPWDIVLVYALDRFGRNSIEVAVNKQRLKKNGKVLISATQRTSDNIDGSKNLDGILLENVYIGLAEYYSAELSQKVKRGLNESRQKGQYTGGTKLYGYDIIEKKYVINPTEAEVIRNIFIDYANGKTAKVICQELNEQGINNKYKRPFTRSNIYKMLRNEKYIGILRFGEEVFTETVPAIVDNETYEVVQQIIAKNKLSPAHRKSIGTFPLSGKLFCGDCGALMTGDSGTSHTGDTHYYYTCTKHKQGKGCKMPSVQKELIESIVLNECEKVLASGFIPMIVESAYKNQLEDIESNITVINLRGELREKQKILDNIMKAIEQGIFTKSTKDRLQELEKDIEELNIKLEIEKAKQENVASKDDYTNFLNQFLERQFDDDDFKDALFSTLVRNVLFFRDKVRITFNFLPDRGFKAESIEISSSELLEKSELLEAQSEYENGTKGSSIFPLSAPKGTNPNLNIFICTDYFGVWVIYRKR